MINNQLLLLFVPDAVNFLNHFHGAKTRTHQVPEGEWISSDQVFLTCSEAVL